MIDPHDHSKSFHRRFVIGTCRIRTRTGTVRVVYRWSTATGTGSLPVGFYR
jgi:hypothetical protein